MTPNERQAYDALLNEVVACDRVIEELERERDQVSAALKQAREAIDRALTLIG